MILSDIGIDSTVELHIVSAQKKMFFSTKVLEKIEMPSKHLGFGLKCEQVRNDEGKLIGFSNVLVKAKIKNTVDGRMYEYMLSACNNGKTEPVLLIYSLNNPKPINHRETFRVPCNYRAVIQVGQNRKTIDAYVHDISFTGIAFTYPQGAVTASPGQKISATIYETDEHTIKVKPDVVRVVPEWSKNLSLIGAHFPQSSDEINKLVACAQIKELRVRHDN